MRICSFLPAATEILYELNAGDSLFGVTFECDCPPEARRKDVVVRTRLRHSENPAEIDRQVKEFVARGESLYEVDREALQAIQPDLIITQDLCHVCAASPGDLASALAGLPRQPKVLSLNPQSLADVWQGIQTVGTAIGRASRAREVVEKIKARLSAVAEAVSHSEAKPRTACIEWLNPPFVAGHWVPEMVACAEGMDVLGKAGEPGFRTTWTTVLKSRPEFILAMPCGYSMEQASHDFNTLTLPEEWEALPAARDGNIFAVDASGYFSRPGPRRASGVEILAAILHPEAGTAPPPPVSFSRLAPITHST